MLSLSAHSSHSQQALEIRLINLEKTHRAEIDSLKAEHKIKLNQIRREIILADAAGYQRGIDEMLTKQTDQKNKKTDFQPAVKIESKINFIKIPGVQFFETPLPEVFIELQKQARRFDILEKDSSHKGLNIITLKDGAEPFPLVTITLNSMPLGKMIQFITQMVGWTYDIRKEAIIISKALPERNQAMRTEFFELTQGTINRMIGGGSAEGSDPFAPKSGNSSAGAENTGLKLKAFLESSSIRFDVSMGHKFAFDGFQMIVTHDQKSLDLITRILRKMDTGVSCQHSVSFRILETPFGLFDQALSKTAGYKDEEQNLSIIIRHRAEEIIEKLLSEKATEMLFSTDLLVLDGQPVQYSFAEETIYPTDFLPTFDQNSTVSHPPVPQFDSVSPDSKQPGFREVGLTINLIPKLEKYETTALELSPEISRLNGFKNYGHGIEVPIFWTWKINTAVVLGSNETMVARGASSKEGQEILMFIETSILR
ncbi:MAG: hypothetical protein ACJZ64_03810 [Opitutales bacterium]